MSATVNVRYSGFSCVTWATRARSSGVARVRTDSPSTRSSPSDGANSRAASPNRVLLPAPFGPTTPQIRPAGTVKSQCRSAH